MPEGPEIRRAADRVHRALAGQVAADVFFAFDHLAPFAEALTGRRVQRVTSRGKAILVDFEGELLVYSHNQLYGRWYVHRAGRGPRTQRSLRFAVHNDRSSARLYSASEIHVVERARLGEHPYLAKLGPDALDDAVTVETIAARLDARAFRGRSLGALLLDQGFVAGLGNYLRSEILFVSRLAASMRPRELGDAARERLARAILDQTRRSYATGGVTNEPARVAELAARGATRAEYRFQVFARAGKPCYRCRAPIERSEVGGRRLYRCPRCQAAA